MRAALWLLALFGVAVAVALFAGNNQGTVTPVLAAPPRRPCHQSGRAAAGGRVHHVVGAHLRALAVPLALPHQAQRWRVQSKERHAPRAAGRADAHAGRALPALPQISVGCAGARRCIAKPLASRCPMVSNARVGAFDCGRILLMPCKTGPRAKATCKTPWKRPPPRATGKTRNCRGRPDSRRPLEPGRPGSQRNPGAPRCVAARAARRTLALRIRLKGHTPGTANP